MQKDNLTKKRQDQYRSEYRVICLVSRGFPLLAWGKAANDEGVCKFAFYFGKWPFRNLNKNRKASRRWVAGRLEFD